jgi:hypothetical protein
MKRITRATLSLTTTTLRPLALSTVTGGFATIGCPIAPSAPPKCGSKLCATQYTEYANGCKDL